MSKQHQSLFDRIYHLALMRAEPFEYPNLLHRMIVVPLAETGTIHPCVMLSQATWNTIITFIVSSLTSDQRYLLGTLRFTAFINIHVTECFNNTNKHILPASTFLPPNLSPLLFTFWQRLVTYSLISDVIVNIHRAHWDIFVEERNIYAHWHAQLPYTSFIQYPFESSHSTIRNRVLWFKSQISI